MRGRKEGLACPDPGARTPIGASGNSCLRSFLYRVWILTTCLVKLLYKLKRVWEIHHPKVCHQNLCHLIPLLLHSYRFAGYSHTNLEPSDKPFLNIFENSPSSAQNRASWRGRGVPEICFSLESFSFCYLGAQAKFHKPSCLLSGRKSKGLRRRRKKKKKNNAKYYSHFGAGIRTPLGPTLHYPGNIQIFKVLNTFEEHLMRKKMWKYWLFHWTIHTHICGAVHTLCLDQFY